MNNVKNWHWKLLIVFAITMIGLEAYWAYYLYTPNSFSRFLLPDKNIIDYNSKWLTFRDSSIITIVLTAFVAFLIWLITVWIRSLRWKIMIRQFFVVSYILFIIWNIRAVWFNPLPSDEAYIAQFTAHKKDIERLVDLYRHYDEIMAKQQNKVSFYKWPESRQLMAKTGVSRLYGQFADDELKKPTGVKFGNVFPNERHTSFRFGPATIYKELYYTVEEQKVDKKNFTWPDGSKYYARLFDSLNDYPPDYWARWECVYRLIDPHWYLRMCRS